MRRRVAVQQPDEAVETPSRRHGVPGRWRRVRIRAPGVSQLIRVLGAHTTRRPEGNGVTLSDSETTARLTETGFLTSHLLPHHPGQARNATRPAVIGVIRPALDRLWTGPGARAQLDRLETDSALGAHSGSGNDASIRHFWAGWERATVPGTGERAWSVAPNNRVKLSAPRSPARSAAGRRSLRGCCAHTRTRLERNGVSWTCRETTARKRRVDWAS